MSDGTGLHNLHAQLDVIATALETDDLAAAGAGAEAYDTALRGYVEACAPGRTPMDALRELLRLQNSLLLCMAEKKKGIAGELREARKAGKASRAYAAELAG